MKKKLGIWSVVIGSISYVFMITKTITGAGEGVSLTTFGLWAIISWITVFTMFKQKANPAVPVIFGIGSTTTALTLVSKGSFNWTGVDMLVAVIVAICIFAWITKGAKWALVLSVLAGVIASIPFVVMTWKFPENSPFGPNCGFLVSNFLSFVSAKEWRLEDRLYGGVNVILCSLLIIPWFFR